MKKLCNAVRKMAAAVVVAALVLGVMPLAVQADSAIRVTIDGAEVTFEGQGPVIVDGRTLVPVRGVFEQLGFEPIWDGEARTATLTREDYVIVITIDSAAFTTNGETYTLDVPAQIMNDSTMLPLRAVLESVGYELEWDDDTRTVLITSAAEQTAPPLAPPADEPTEDEPTEDEPTQDEPTIDESTDTATDEADEASDEPTAEESTTPEFTSFQQILDYYTAKLNEAAPLLAAEFRVESAELTEIADVTNLSLTFIERFAAISIEGTLEMADLLLSGVGTEEEFESYSGKLSAVYMEASALLTETFMDVLFNL